MNKQSSMPPLPEGVRTANEQFICLTDTARRKLAQLSEREDDAPFLRIRVTGGGCSGLSYKLKFVREARQGDILVNSPPVHLLVDSKSALYLRGMTLDYSDRLVAGGFKFNNPNA